MKSMLKILVRYVASAAGVAMVLLLLNAAVLIAWIAKAGEGEGVENHIVDISDSLIMENGCLVITQEGQDYIHERYVWAMLLDNSGKVIWSETLPDDVKRSYTVSEVAGFTHWYLKDYPVYVWRNPNGLLVLGSAKDSVWKMQIELPQRMLDEAWVVGLLILNGAAAIFLALLFGLRLFRSLRTTAKGISDMAKKQPLDLPERGVFGELSEKLNQTSKELIRQETLLHQRDCSRTEWIIGVSHDIRTPLSVVMGYASQLEENPSLSANEQAQARIIRQQTERIKALVSDLNLASKLEYEMQPLRMDLVSLPALARSVVADFLNNGLDPSYSIDLQVSEEAQRISLTGDSELLRRALTNLIGNSIRHNPKGCAIILRVAKEFAVCAITVSDDGDGYPPEVLESLSKPDVPVELRNHGLGLTIVRQIVKAHDGTAEFFNLPKGGCRVVLRLPGNTQVG